MAEWAYGTAEKYLGKAHLKICEKMKRKLASTPIEFTNRHRSRKVVKRKSQGAAGEVEKARKVTDGAVVVLNSERKFCREKGQRSRRGGGRGGEGKG